jgi:competence ComEA-like helix-hairpin-helix protein
MIGKTANHTIFILGVTLAVVVTASAAPRSETRNQDPSSDKGAADVQRVCSNCHPITRVTASRRSRSQWEEVIETMITTRGARVTDEEFETIVGYLTRAYGRVNVNQAPAEELGEVLGISEKVAATIVTYRHDHGAFQDFDALAKVPGIDREALEKKRDAISF